jgi:predicted RNA-binding Zn-ribbon protein involved in translation (DUF1610 family)
MYPLMKKKKNSTCTANEHEIHVKDSSELNACPGNCSTKHIHLFNAKHL